MNIKRNLSDLESGPKGAIEEKGEDRVKIVAKKKIKENWEFLNRKSSKEEFILITS